MKNIATVWIIEDNVRLLNSLEKCVNQADDLRCTGVFTSCESALAALADNPAPQILLTDIGLPGMNGIEGIRELKIRIPDLEPLVLTVSDDSGKVFAAIQAGASGYLLKSASMAEIIDGCRKVAEGAASLNENIARMMLNAFRKNSVAKPRRKPDAAEHNLTKRELDILQLLAAAYSVKMIADELDISENTVRFHTKNLYKKLHAQSQTSAISEARKRGIL